MTVLPDPTGSLTGPAKAIFEDMAKRRAAKGVDHLGPYVPLLNYPELARCIERLGYFYKFESELPQNIYQFVVLEVGRQSGVEFVWRDHLAKAKAAGVPDPVIAVIAGEAGTLDEPYQMVRDLMDWAFRYKSIPEDLQNRAIAEFGVEGLLEIVTLCGFYSMIGMVNACFDVPLPKEVKS